MKKKNIFQIIILLSIVVISAFTYKKYFRAENFKKNVVIVENENQNQAVIEDSSSTKERNIIKDIKYFNEDINGNKFTIQAKKGEISQNDTDLIALSEVVGIINLKGKSEIYIYSKFANYNSNNFDTKFFSEVTTTYEDNIISSENLDIFFKDNHGLMYNNIKFSNKNSKILADKLFFDLLNGDIKINMYNQEDKIIFLNK